jgi:hypothetical protein
MGRAKEFVDKFKSSAKLIMEKSPDSLMIHISIYARDTETKTE